MSSELLPKEAAWRRGSPREPLGTLESSLEEPTHLASFAGCLAASFRYGEKAAGFQGKHRTEDGSKTNSSTVKLVVLPRTLPSS